MTAPAKRNTDRNILVLQGGGALGSYQGGVVEALHDADIHPAWIAGISIGAINAALVAGNPPERRLERMRAFWELVTSNVPMMSWWPNDRAHTAYNEWSAAWGTAVGAPGFFVHYMPPRVLYLPNLPGPVSYYDTSPLRDTLVDLVDFDLINRKDIRFSVGAVNVATGGLKWFDNFKTEIRPEHIMASGALPPGFPPVEIDGQFYWDGGLVSNTPLQWVLDEAGAEKLTIFQVDLFPAHGPLPLKLSDVSEREKDIRFSSRTRLNTDAQVASNRLKSAFQRLLHKMPADLRDDPDARFLAEHARETSAAIMQLIYQRKPYEGGVKDYEFSRATMMEHWATGLADATRALADPRWAEICRQKHQISVFDPARAMQPIPTDARSS